MVRAREGEGNYSFGKDCKRGYCEYSLSIFQMLLTWLAIIDTLVKNRFIL